MLKKPKRIIDNNKYLRRIFKWVMHLTYLPTPGAWWSLNPKQNISLSKGLNQWAEERTDREPRECDRGPHDPFAPLLRQRAPQRRRRCGDRRGSHHRDPLHPVQLRHSHHLCFLRAAWVKLYFFSRPQFRGADLVKPEVRSRLWK